ncbi:MAG: EamA family transporter [Halioglobus sp.]
MTLRDQLVALIITLIWGTNFVFIRYALDELPPFTFATLRFVLVAVPLIFILKRPQVPWRYLVGYGFFIGFGQFGLLFWVMQDNITPGLASLIIQIQVFFTIFLAAIITKEAIGQRQFFALAICLTGLLTIIAFTDGQTTRIGVAVTLMAAAGWACGNQIVKQVGSVDILAFIVWSSLFSIPPLLLMAFFLEGGHEIVSSIETASWRAWAVILWQSVGNTLIGYGCWNFLLGRYSAAKVAPWALLVPVFGMGASAVMLGESMPWWKLLAMALIFSGLAINMRGAKSLDISSQTA